MGLLEYGKEILRKFLTDEGVISRLNIRFSGSFCPMWFFFLFGYFRWRFFCSFERTCKDIWGNTLAFFLAFSSFLNRSVNKKTALYIFIFVVTWFPGLFILTTFDMFFSGLINRFLGIISPNNSVYWLYVLQSALSPLHGFFNSIVYGFKWSDSRSWKSWFF